MNICVSDKDLLTTTSNEEVSLQDFLLILNASELLENFEEMLPWYCVANGVKKPHIILMPITKELTDYVFLICVNFYFTVNLIEFAGHCYNGLINVFDA